MTATSRHFRRIADTSLSPRDDWRAQAACRDYDPEAWFPVAQPGRGLAGSRLVAVDVEAAKSVCATCEARVPCLDGALERDERYGIWGGLTTDERDRLRAKGATA